MSPTLAWHAQEFFYRKKTPDWFWILGITTLTGAVVAVVFGNALLAVLIIIGAFAMALAGAKTPRHLSVLLSDRGIRINETLYPYQNLDSFWVSDATGRPPQLIFASKRLLMPLIMIPIDEVNPEDVRAFLTNRLQEKEHEEPFSQKLLEFIGL